MSWQDILKNEMDIKTLEEIAGELEKAVEAHGSQAKRIREIISQYKKEPPTKMPSPQYITNRPKTAGQQSMIDRATRNLREQERR
tara:strand:+ start:926 stop:1180 length:255 start_codon:yes stop_codon:yes gene_type:complete